MSVSLELATAVGAGLVVQLGWPPDPLSRLTPPPSMALPAWLSARTTALPARARAIGATGVALVVLFLMGSAAALMLAIPAWVFVFCGLGRLETNGAAGRRSQLVAELPAALDLLSACAVAGMPLRTATAAVAAAVGGVLGDRLGTVVSHAAAGFGDSDAWAALGCDEVLGPVARDLSRAADAGTSVGGMLARHAESARAFAQAAAIARAKAVGVRTIVPVSVCYLPAFFLIGVVPVIAGILTTLLR
ncbi:MAG: type II secretion system F family protein [Propionibacteriaceae bacterium]